MATLEDILLLGLLSGNAGGKGAPRANTTRQAEPPPKIDPTQDTAVTGPGPGGYQDTDYGRAMLDNYWRLFFSQMPPIGPEAISQLIMQSLAGAPAMQGQPMASAGGGMTPPGPSIPTDGVGATAQAMPSTPMPNMNAALSGAPGSENMQQSFAQDGMPGAAAMQPAMMPPGAPPGPGMMPTPRPPIGPQGTPAPMAGSMVPQPSQVDPGLLAMLQNWNEEWKRRNQGNSLLRPTGMAPVMR